MAAEIHPTAIVADDAIVHADAIVGPFCIVESGVEIGERTILKSHVCVYSGTTIGEDCKIHAFVAIGDLPQDLAHKNVPSYVRIGNHCTLREGVTIHRGTEEDTTSSLGDNCYLMANSHVAHNCIVGDNVILAHNAILGGRVQIGRNVFVGGVAAIHQFCRVGEYAMIAGVHRQLMDAPPFMTAGIHGVSGVNVVGLRRAGFSKEERLELQQAHKLLYRSGVGFREAVEMLSGRVTTDPGKKLVEFLQAPSKRGIDGFRRRNDRD